MHLIDILESDVMEIAKKIEKGWEVKKRLYHRASERRQQTTNRLYQYGRRKTLSVSGNANRQSSETTRELFINTIKKKTGLDISEHEIDIAFRLGKYRHDKQRPIIIKFVIRQTKVKPFKYATQFAAVVHLYQRGPDENQPERQKRS